MSINETVLTKVIEATKKENNTGKKLTIYSGTANIILRYLDLATPVFSRSGAASELLESIIKTEYPELWARVCSGKVPATVPLLKSYLPKRFPKIDNEVWGQAVSETETRIGKIITIYNPRVSAVIRYNTQTTPRYSISKESALLMEKALEEKYPQVWGKAQAQQPVQINYDKERERVRQNYPQAHAKKTEPK